MDSRPSDFEALLAHLFSQSFQSSHRFTIQQKANTTPPTISRAMPSGCRNQTTLIYW